MQYNKTSEFKSEQLKKAHKHAASKGGTCHSLEYINSETKLEWSCNNHNHFHWFSLYSKVVNKNQWCRDCANEKLKNKHGLTLAKEYALAKGGMCVSKEYVNAITKLEWKCHNSNHKSWFSNFNRVVSGGSWCPDCGSNRNVQENRVRNILNAIFNTEFIKSKVQWNINPETGKKLELDGYCKKSNIAFEYQGEHHFLTSKFNNQEELEYIQRKDEYKLNNCKLNGVKLIVVNYIKNGNTFEPFMQELYKAIKKAEIDYNIIHNLDILKSLFNSAVGNSIQEDMLKKAKEHANLRGGQCLSTEYINNRTKLEWKCKNTNHPSWLAVYNSIVDRNSWCSLCADEKSSLKQRKPNGLKLAQDYAKSKGGECLSINYISGKDKLEWKCHNSNHKSWLSHCINTIYNKQWCPECAGNQKLNGLILAQEYATSKNGKCLSDEYVNTKIKLKWKCINNKHSIFHKSFEHAVRRGQWCPDCYKESNIIK